MYLLDLTVSAIIYGSMTVSVGMIRRKNVWLTDVFEQFLDDSGGCLWCFHWIC